MFKHCMEINFQQLKEMTVGQANEIEDQFLSLPENK